MNILFYEYGSICEPDILCEFQKLGLNVVEEKTEIFNKSLLPSERIDLVTGHFDHQPFLFVFSINFFPSISDICELYRIPYVCWSVDSPVLELFSKSILNTQNHIFLFDKKQLQDVLSTIKLLLKASDPSPTIEDYQKNIIHLPLATNINRWDDALSTISDRDFQKYSADISFVGSLYSEKDPYLSIDSLSEHTKGYSDGIVQAQNLTIGSNILENSLPDDIVSEYRTASTQYFEFSDACCQSLPCEIKQPLQKKIDTYITAHQILGLHASSLHRLDLLNTLSSEFSVALYTRSASDGLTHIKSRHPAQSNETLTSGIELRGGVKTFTEMPKIFHLSKINLNMTIFPIQTGLSLRIWDVLGCQGFLLTNFQEELLEHFTPGVDLDCYTSREDLIEKCRYYLSHEEIRKRIAYNGYLKLKKNHTYTHRITQLISHLSNQK